MVKAKAEAETKRAIAKQNVARERGDGKKPLMSMNTRGTPNAPTIDPVQWLENADSYSWFARRMWKRAGRPDK